MILSDSVTRRAASKFSAMDPESFNKKYGEIPISTPLSKAEQALEEELDEFEKEWDQQQVRAVVIIL